MRSRRDIFKAIGLCGAISGFLAFLIGLPGRARADSFTDALVLLRDSRVITISDWKFHQPDIPNGQMPAVSDADWQTVHPGFVWHGENTRVWFRTQIVVPDEVAGVSTEGAPMYLQIGVDDDGEVYVNGELRDSFHWDEGNVLISPHVRPGEKFFIAVRGINGPGDGRLMFSRLVFGPPGPWQPNFDWVLQEMQFLQQLALQVPAQESERIRNTLAAAEAKVDGAHLTSLSLEQSAAQLAAAHETLMSLRPLTQNYDVYYVGHAHIDMNWLWPWPETIDVCHRTWASALKLMNAFPDFGFVQSQPGAYMPIQHRYPQEFAAIQAAVQRGQWDPVSGFWDESDTDMPSGEALARSLFLGQRYFYKHFGRYAITGWLPDSFGHSWQIPQLLRNVGIVNYYHMRCNDGIYFSWWESPDGSRVLKASTNSYDEPVTVDQMVRPWQIENGFGLKKALVVFGVGDHGGGPTRQMILIGKQLQQDPLMPKVHFCTTDKFFDVLRSDPNTAQLPVVDRDLQYTLEGCYTTHADIKKAVRSTENALYTAEAFSSLAAMSGLPCPVQGFEEAWKPTAFAQFHDIMCGSAIHSTYSWMESYLTPARQWAEQQTAKALQTLTSRVDTRGAKKGEKTVVVWNALSYACTGPVKVSVPQATLYHSVRDAAGHLFPAQALASDTLLFIARDVPGFGHKLYFLSTKPCASHLSVSKGRIGDYVLQNAFLRLEIDPRTGLMQRLEDLHTGRELFAASANELQLLGDTGSAWVINFTGQQQLLITQGAQVRLLSSGPVVATVQVTHALDKSSYVQDISLYDGLERVDVQNDVQWHEHNEMLKVAFPLAMQHPKLHVSIPYGSIDRPDNGQENPGQKWMDMTDYSGAEVLAATPLDLHAWFNSDSNADFDSQGRGYPRNLFPSPGLRTVGSLKPPILLHGNAPGPDNIACEGQTVSLPPTAKGNTLLLVGAGALGSQGGLLKLQLADGHEITQAIAMGDWVTGGQSETDVMDFPYRLINNGTDKENTPAHLWMISVALPNEERVVRVQLPQNPNLHLFAATVATLSPGRALWGVTFVNDSKYGNDANGPVFRLSLLRSSHDPDPDPDEGEQRFAYALIPHSGDWRAARAEELGKAFNIPLQAVLASAHPAKSEGVPSFTLSDAEGWGDLVAGALKHCEDGKGYILRFFETQGRNTVAKLHFSVPVQVTQTDILERPVPGGFRGKGKVFSIPVGHDKIVTLHIVGLPDAGVAPPPNPALPEPD